MSNSNQEHIRWGQNILAMLEKLPDEQFEKLCDACWQERRRRLQRDLDKAKEKVRRVSEK